jgi:hypothetical protein
MIRTNTHEFVDNWVQGWNTHDLDKVLSHFSEAVVFSSPQAVQLVSGSDGIIRGKHALRQYWEEGLRRIPDLRSDVLGVYVGVGAPVINYRNQKGGRANEFSSSRETS